MHPGSRVLLISKYVWARRTPRSHLPHGLVSYVGNPPILGDMPSRGAVHCTSIPQQEQPQYIAVLGKKEPGMVPSTVAHMHTVLWRR